MITAIEKNAISLSRYLRHYYNVKESLWISWKYLFLELGYLSLAFILTSCETFTPKDAKAILEKHNEYRTQESASNMYKMHWNMTLQERADGWAQKCLFKHERNLDVGENLFFDTDHENDVLLRGLGLWQEEKNQYHYTSEGCLTTCHYTQMVTGYSTTVGCSTKICPALRVGSRVIRDAILLVCYYYPRGNFIGHFPYKHGSPCSECATGDTCSNGLCITSTPESKTAPEFIRSLRPMKPFSPHRPIKSVNAFKALLQTFSTSTTHLENTLTHQSHRQHSHHYHHRHENHRQRQQQYHQHRYQHHNKQKQTSNVQTHVTKFVSKTPIAQPLRQSYNHVTMHRTNSQTRLKVVHLNKDRLRPDRKSESTRNTHLHFSKEGNTQERRRDRERSMEAQRRREAKRLVHWKRAEQKRKTQRLREQRAWAVQKEREERKRKERIEREKRKQEERDRKAREEREDIERREREKIERREREQRERREQDERGRREREERERRQWKERERKEREELKRREREEKERQDREESERQYREQREKQGREEIERHERFESERREWEERQEREGQEREKREREETEERERKEQDERERREREQKEQRERIEKETREREQREQNQQKEREETERREREERERQQQQKQELEESKRIEREMKEREERERRNNEMVVQSNQELQENKVEVTEMVPKTTFDNEAVISVVSTTSHYPNMDSSTVSNIFKLHTSSQSLDTDIGNSSIIVSKTRENYEREKIHNTVVNENVSSSPSKKHEILDLTEDSTAEKDNTSRVTESLIQSSTANQQNSSSDVVTDARMSLLSHFKELISALNSHITQSVKNSTPPSRVSTPVLKSTHSTHAYTESTHSTHAYKESTHSTHTSTESTHSTHTSTESTHSTHTSTETTSANAYPTLSTETPLTTASLQNALTTETAGLFHDIETVNTDSIILQNTGDASTSGALTTQTQNVVLGITSTNKDSLQIGNKSISSTTSTTTPFTKTTNLSKGSKSDQMTSPVSNFDFIEKENSIRIGSRPKISRNTLISHNSTPVISLKRGMGNYLHRYNTKDHVAIPVIDYQLESNDNNIRRTNSNSHLVATMVKIGPGKPEKETVANVRPLISENKSDVIIRPRFPGRETNNINVQLGSREVTTIPVTDKDPSTKISKKNNVNNAEISSNQIVKHVLPKWRKRSKSRVKMSKLARKRAKRRRRRFNRRMLAKLLRVKHPHNENYALDRTGRRCVDLLPRCSLWVAKCHKSAAVTLSCPLSCGKCGQHVDLNILLRENSNLVHDSTLFHNKVDRKPQSDFKKRHKKRKKNKESNRIQAATNAGKPQAYIHADDKPTASPRKKKSRGDRRHRQRNRIGRRKKLKKKGRRKKHRPSKDKEGSCRDDPSYIKTCRFWAKRGFCEDNRLLKSVFCRWSCGACD